MKKITCFFLVLLALVFIFPVLFLVVGSLMGKNELTDLLFPVLQEGADVYKRQGGRLTYSHQRSGDYRLCSILYADRYHLWSASFC